MTDDRFDRALRAFLVERAPIGAPASLRSRVAAVPAEMPPLRPRWRTRSIEAWRGAAGLIAAAALGLLVIALLSQVGRITIREGDAVGAPSDFPLPAGRPFIEAPDGFFTSTALAEAEQRLGRIYRDTRVEGTLIVRTMPDRDTLTAPDDWQERYDRDGDDRRDVVAVAGITPDDTILCCITLTGETIDRARQNLYWQPVTQPSALDDELSASTSAERDAALGGFVRGIGDLATGITELGLEPHPGDVLIQWMPAVLALAIVALAIAALPRRRHALAPPSPGGESATPVVDPDVPSMLEMPSNAVTARWSLAGGVPLYGALCGFAVLAILTLVDVLRAPDPSVAFDPARATVGIAQRIQPVVPVVALSISFIALLVHALQGGWRRRLGVGAAVLLIYGSAWVAIGRTLPAERPTDIPWTSSENGHVTSRSLDGLRESVTFDVSPGETFTLGGVIRNPGVLPMTLLGLDVVQPTSGNPYVAAIVGLGWVPQPTDDGRVHVVSAAPGSASAAWPITLAPGEELSILLLGRAGECAEAGATGTAGLLFHVPIRYRVLGIELTSELPLPASTFVSAKDGCTVETVNGTITYGPAPSS